MKKRNLTVVLLITVIVLMLSLTACGGLFSNNSDTSKYFIEIGKVEDARVASIVANNTISSCVRVITEYKNGIVSAGSGFVITEDGYVLTNRHCAIKFNSTSSDVPMYGSEKPLSASYSVVFADNKEYPASLVAYSTAADVAVLKIMSAGLSLMDSKFKPIVFETVEKLYYGERVYTIGNPENIGLILTELTIASPALKLSKNDEYNSIILDGNINHGNSGGPLLNAYSRVSGIVYARIEGSNKDTYGIGCAIPTSVIISFLDGISGVKIKYKTTPTSASGEAA